MHRPVLVTPPSFLPISAAEAKVHLRVEHGDDDALIEGFIRAATNHLDGWRGILGACMVEQVWRQEFDGFARCLRLPLGPVIAIGSVTWRNAAGALSTVSPASYDLRTDAGGRSLVRFDEDFSFPSGLHESRGVTVTYTAGYPNATEPAGPSVPHNLVVAIMMMVGNWYENRDAVVVGKSTVELPLGARMLVAPFRRNRF